MHLSQSLLDSIQINAEWQIQVQRNKPLRGKRMSWKLPTKGIPVHFFEESGYEQVGSETDVKAQTRIY